MHDCRRFGRLEIRPAERLLLVEGRAVALGARAFDLLLVLVERRDRVVGKDELLEAVWPGLVVEENNLAVHVSALRKLLGPRAIATIPGRGYRFVLPETPIEAAAAAGETAAMPPREAPAGATPPPPAAPVRGPGWPGPPPALLGREADLAQLDALWAHARCITVVGAGGIGKTTLARAAAHVRLAACRDGVAWVDLADTEPGDRVGAAVAQALGVDAVDGGDPRPALLAALAPLHLLLVLDNAEHVLEPVARIVRAVLQGAPDVRLLVTSQAPLRVDGEHVFRLGALAVPQAPVDAAQALAHGAVALFAEQARAAHRHFDLTDANVATVVTLCRQLDGVPLALKLAAARLPLLGLNGLVDRLGDRLRVLRHPGRDAPARQQALVAALDWSHALLDAPLQAALRRLAVFAGGFPLEMAGRVAADEGSDGAEAIDALAELVDRSLVEVDAGDPPRYRLPETVRQYARLKLEAAGELEATQHRHAEAVREWMAHAYECFWSEADQPWLARHAPELDNVRAALEAATPSRPALAMELVGSTAVLFMLLGHAPEARRRFARLETAAHEAGTTPASARYWLERSRLQWRVDGTAMLEFASRAVAGYRALGDARGLALALRCVIGSEALGPEDTAAVLAELAALVPSAAPPRLRAQRLLAEVATQRQAGRVAEAAAASQALLRLATDEGLDGMATAALAALASARLAAGDPEGALECARRLLDDPRARRGSFLLHALGTIAEAHLLQGRLDLAREALANFATASCGREWEWLGLYAGLFAACAALAGHVDDAARLLGYAEQATRGAHGLRPSAHDAPGSGPAWTARARAALADRLDAETLERLAAEGARLDEAGACALALAAPWPTNDPDSAADSSAARRRAVTSSLTGV